MSRDKVEPASKLAGSMRNPRNRAGLSGLLANPADRHEVAALPGFETDRNLVFPYLGDQQLARGKFLRLITTPLIFYSRQLADVDGDSVTNF